MVSSKNAAARQGTSALTIIALVLAAFAALFYYLDQHLEWFYIFEPAQLHDLSQRAIAAHGNDTRAVVEYIVSGLQEKVGANYLNFDQEWVFNNAGGAMGAMYIIHASEFLFCMYYELELTSAIRHHGISHHLRFVPSSFFALLSLPD